MKILYYSAHPNLKLNAATGPGTHMREMINAMRDLGHVVLPVIIADIVNSHDSVEMGKKYLFIKKVIKMIIPGILWRSVKDYLLVQFDKRAQTILETMVNEFKPDLVYERAAYMQLSGVKVVNDKKINHYMEINAPFLEEARYFENASTLFLKKVRLFEKIIISEPNKIFVVSSALKNYYSKYINNTEKIIVTPNCINPNNICVDNQVKEKLIKEYSLSGKRVIGFVGSIFPYHGVDILIEAFAMVAKKYPNMVLIIVGDGAIIPDLKQKCNKLNIYNNVVFTGSVKHSLVFTYIDLMHITVIAKSHWYCSPVKIFEYGAMNKPIIASNTVSIKDVMENKIDGLLVKDDPQHIADAIEELIVNEEKYRVIAENFYNKVMKNYTWHSTAEMILS